ncbi:MAG: hypothetical protein KKH08_00070, partial [Candidatus Omnitrophica bacterium]|nr:hypothetical protein [Candidatus Omnitrophota bacterium]
MDKKKDKYIVINNYQALLDIQSAVSKVKKGREGWEINNNPVEFGVLSAKMNLRLAKQSRANFTFKTEGIKEGRVTKFNLETGQESVFVGEKEIERFKDVMYREAESYDQSINAFIWKHNGYTYLVTIEDSEKGVKEDIEKVYRNAEKYVNYLNSGVLRFGQKELPEKPDISGISGEKLDLGKSTGETPDVKEEGPSPSTTFGISYINTIDPYTGKSITDINETLNINRAFNFGKFRGGFDSHSIFSNFIGLFSKTNDELNAANKDLVDVRGYKEAGATTIGGQDIDERIKELESRVSSLDKSANIIRSGILGYWIETEPLHLRNQDWTLGFWNRGWLQWGPDFKDMYGFSFGTDVEYKEKYSLSAKVALGDPYRGPHSYEIGEGNRYELRLMWNPLEKEQISKSAKADANLTALFLQDVGGSHPGVAFNAGITVGDVGKTLLNINVNPQFYKGYKPLYQLSSSLSTNLGSDTYLTSQLYWNNKKNTYVSFNLFNRSINGGIKLGYYELGPDASSYAQGSSFTQFTLPGSQKTLIGGVFIDKFSINAVFDTRDPGNLNRLNVTWNPSMKEVSDGIKGLTSGRKTSDDMQPEMSEYEILLQQNKILKEQEEKRIAQAKKAKQVIAKTPAAQIQAVDNLLSEEEKSVLAHKYIRTGLENLRAEIEDVGKDGVISDVDRDEMAKLPAYFAGEIKDLSPESDGIIRKSKFAQVFAAETAKQTLVFIAEEIIGKTAELDKSVIDKAVALYSLLLGEDAIEYIQPEVDAFNEAQSLKDRKAIALELATRMKMTNLQRMDWTFTNPVWTDTDNNITFQFGNSYVTYRKEGSRRYIEKAILVDNTIKDINIGLQDEDLGIDFNVDGKGYTFK